MLRREMQPVKLMRGQVLGPVDGSGDQMYFPETSVVSLMNFLGTGETLELGSIGREGIVGLPAFAPDASSSFRFVVRASGGAARVSTDIFDSLTACSAQFRRQLERYSRALVAQLVHTATCNAMHDVRQRSARALLVRRDQTGADGFAITQEELAEMLGVRRAGVTHVMGRFAEQTLISYRRGFVTIARAAALREAACDCYEALRVHLAI